jgi:hypothetical protein
MNMIQRGAGAALVVALGAACSEEGSLGEYPESSGTAVDDGAGSTGDDDGATTASTGDASGSGPTSGDGTTTDASATVGDSGSSSDTTPEACEQPGNCVEFSPCGADPECGTLESLFDENGCVKEECQDHEQCEDGELCYRAIDFGGCAPSGVFCEDDPDLQTCSCGSNPECGGGFCVPQEQYPTAAGLPETDAIAELACAPNDGPGVHLRWGGEGTCDLAGLRMFEVTAYEGPLAVGTFEFDGSPATGFGWYRASDGTDVEVLSATIEITAYDGAVVSGSVEATLAPNVDGVQIVGGELVDLPVCETSQPCG